jgi:hypothetical protein
VGLEWLKSTAKLYGPVWHQWLGSVVAKRRGQSLQMAEALLWLGDKERGTSQYCSALMRCTLPMPLRGSAEGTRAQSQWRRASSCLSTNPDVGLALCHSCSSHCEIPGSERADDVLGARGKASWRRKCRSSRKLWPGLTHHQRPSSRTELWHAARAPAGSPTLKCQDSPLTVALPVRMHHPLGCIIL